MIIPNIIPPYATDLKKASSPSYPKLVSGLQLWLDASDNSTVLQSITDNTAYASSGSVVKKWLDKGPIGNHLTGNVDTILVTSCRYDLNTLNGKPVVTFPRNGSGFLRTAGNVSNFNFIHWGISEIYCVFFADLGSQYSKQYIIRNTTGAYSGITMEYFASPQATSPSFQAFIKGNNPAGYFTNKQPFNYPSMYNNFVLYNIKSDVTAPRGSRMEYYLNNQSGGGVDNSSLTVDYYNASDEFCIGKGDKASGQSKYAELIIYNRHLNSTERTGMYNYLKNKWGLPY